MVNKLEQIERTIPEHFLLGRKANGEDSFAGLQVAGVLNTTLLS
jgi:hypothetical protein